MWGWLRKKKVNRIDSLIGHGTEIQGDIVFSGGLHIDGVVKGGVTAREESGSILALSEQGTIHGDVRAPNIILNGTVMGDVYALEHLELKPNARITGNVYYNLIELMVGAEVNGSLVHTSMLPSDSPLSLEHSKIKDKENVFPLHEKSES
jgi:cytoskeletal protein CcmA (bactofilin family)